jgi:integrase
VLTDAEIVAVWNASQKIASVYGRVVRMLLLTGCRLNEAAGMRRSELEDSIWTIPADRAKNRRAHRLPLPPMAREIIGNASHGPHLVFDTGMGRPPTSWSRTKAQLAKHAQLTAPWRIHDIRRTVATGMQRLRVRSEVIEQALNHVSGHRAGVAGIYQRDPLTEEVREALQRWAKAVSGVW